MALQKWIQGFLAVVTNFSAIRKCKYHVDDLRNNNILLLLPIKGLFLFVLNKLVDCFFLPVFLWEEGTALPDLSEVWKLWYCFCWWPAVAFGGWAVNWNEFGGAAVWGGGFDPWLSCLFCELHRKHDYSCHLVERILVEKREYLSKRPTYHQYQQVNLKFILTRGSCLQFQN